MRRRAARLAALSVLLLFIALASTAAAATTAVNIQGFAFVPPSVTIKDYTSSGATGYPNPKPGAQPERFPTIIQIVPAPR